MTKWALSQGCKDSSILHGESSRGNAAPVTGPALKYPELSQGTPAPTPACFEASVMNVI